MNAIERIIKYRGNVLALLPTGYGKSSCYILPPLVLDQQMKKGSHHIAIVISPLKSLVYDQN
ncbi:putative ATP-dependent DNA helicase RecS [Tubulanus polymorphus]|uniref:putative ATP-dependent DNA helicase RecS n=1 Tax=Tubulanus polymorphus TaxID=672921 RepID=UPI003DA2CA1E